MAIPVGIYLIVMLLCLLGVFQFDRRVEKLESDEWWAVCTAAAIWPLAGSAIVFFISTSVFIKYAPVLIKKLNKEIW